MEGMSELEISVKEIRTENLRVYYRVFRKIPNVVKLE